MVLVCDPSRRDLAPLQGSKHFRAGRGRHGEGSNRHGARGEDREIPVPPGTQGMTVDGSLLRPRRRRPARRRRPGRPRRARQQALRQLDPPGAALRREGDRRRGGLDRAAPEAARRRRADRPAQRRQVLAARPADPGGAEGRRLPLHDALAGARGDRRRGPPGGHRRHPRADRGRRRGRRPRPRVPRPRRALRDARPPRRRRPAGGRPGANYEAVRAELATYGAGLDRLPELVVLSKRDLLPADDVGAAIREWRPRLGDGRARTCSPSPRRPARGWTSCAGRSSPRCPTAPGADSRPAGAPARPSSRSSTASTGRPARAATRSSARTTAASASSAAGSSCSSSATISRTKRRSPTSRAASTRSASIAALRAAGFEAGDDVRVGEHEFELHI